MGVSKAEVKLRRLLAALSEQTNQAKLKHYLATSREQLLILTGEDAENLPRITPAKTKEYSDRILALAEKVNANPPLDIWESLRPQDERQLNLASTAAVTAAGSDIQQPVPDAASVPSQSDPAALRRRNIVKDKESKKESSPGAGDDQKLDSETHKILQRHRQLQEDLTDEMVLLARQIKETSLMMDHSLRDTEKVLDSTERAVEHSLEATKQANLKAGEIYSKSFGTNCLTCLAVFIMCGMFMFMVLLIRLT